MRILNKIILLFILGFISAIVITGCCKKQPVINSNDFKPNYDLYTKAYINPFMGSLDRGTILTPFLLYIDKYNYWHPCCNPNNNYEIAYCRKNNATQTLSNMDLYTFNFYNGQTKLLTTGAKGWIDWSSTNWILYTATNGKMYKIKPNGDSNIILTPNNTGYDGKWSPNGEIIMHGTRKLIDNNGNFIDTLNQYNSYIWQNNEVIIGLEVTQNSSYIKIYAHNVVTKTREELLNLPDLNTARLYYIYKDVLYFSYADGSFNSVPANFSFNLITKEKKFLSYKNLSFYQSFANHSKDKVIVQLALKDTFTGNPAFINYRCHIAIMNPDGSDIRQVLIPE
jgi:hypothetical protein